MEEDQTKPVCFMRRKKTTKKNSLIKKNLIHLRFKIFAITMELHYNNKNHKSQVNLNFLDQTDFFIKQSGLIWY